MVTMKKSVTMEAVKSLLLEWDGDGSGLEAVETAGGTLYKVADVIVQNEDIPGMTVTDSEGKETLVTDSVYNDMISRSLVGEGFAAKVAGYVYLAQKDVQAPGAKLPSGGIWLLKKQDGSYPKKVVLPAYREAFLQGEKPDGEKGESMGGGVTSWNDLKDRPFEDNRKIEEVKIEWDGNTEGRTTFDLGDGLFLYKISDKTPTMNEIENGRFSGRDMNGDFDVSVAECVVTAFINMSVGCIVQYGGMPTIAVAHKAFEEFGLFEPGIYVSNNEACAVSTVSFTTLSGEVDTIDPKFIIPVIDLTKLGFPVVMQGETITHEIAFPTDEAFNAYVKKLQHGIVRLIIYSSFSTGMGWNETVRHEAVVPLAVSNVGEEAYVGMIAHPWFWTEEQNSTLYIKFNDNIVTVKNVGSVFGLTE